MEGRHTEVTARSSTLLDGSAVGSACEEGPRMMCSNFTSSFKGVDKGQDVQIIACDGWFGIAVRVGQLVQRLMRCGRASQFDPATDKLSVGFDAGSSRRRRHARSHRRCRIHRGKSSAPSSPSDPPREAVSTASGHGKRPAPLVLPDLPAGSRHTKRRHQEGRRGGEGVAERGRQRRSGTTGRERGREGERHHQEGWGGVRRRRSDAAGRDRGGEEERRHRSGRGRAEGGAHGRVKV
uniref:Uncharacterized protein n=1 Tax=Oryza sativa subsp. japonica TaxID=39947 RepID=Q9AYF4_ORYSJ|nr:Hypothetical protein [Oryza sativa Japonica Group]